MYTAAQLSRGLAVLFVLVLVAHWRLPWILLRQFTVVTSSTLVLLITAHLILLVGSIVGLYRVRPWAFYYVYVMIPFSTFMLSVSFVPFVPRLFPFPMSSIVMLLLNLTVLVVTWVTHVKYLRENREERRVGKAVRPGHQPGGQPSGQPGRR